MTKNYFIIIILGIMLMVGVAPSKAKAQKADFRGTDTSYTSITIEYNRNIRDTTKTVSQVDSILKEGAVVLARKISQIYGSAIEEKIRISLSKGKEKAVIFIFSNKTLDSKLKLLIGECFAKAGSSTTTKCTSSGSCKKVEDASLYNAAVPIIAEKIAKAVKAQKY